MRREYESTFVLSYVLRRFRTLLLFACATRYSPHTARSEKKISSRPRPPVFSGLPIPGSGLFAWCSARFTSGVVKMVRLLITLPRVSVVLPRGRGDGARDDRVRARLRRFRSRSRGKSLRARARTMGFRARVATPSTPRDAARVAPRRRAARRDAAATPNPRFDAVAVARAPSATSPARGFFRVSFPSSEGPSRWKPSLARSPSPSPWR